MMSEENYYRTLGFVYQRGRFEAFVPLKLQKSFEGRYQNATGMKAAPGKDGYSLHDSSVDKWASQLRLTLQADQEELEQLDFGTVGQFEPATSPNPDEWRFNSAKLVWHLWEMGFRNGHVQDKESIRTKIPERYRRAFDEGFPLLLDTPEILNEAGRSYTERLERAGNLGEGVDHLHLKQYVAANGTHIGLFVWESGIQEWQFIAGDRCDIVFDLRDLGKAIVEIKNGEVGELVKGVYQAIKYRALLQAEMGLGADYNVEAILVAYEMPETVREFAQRFDIKCKEISRERVEHWISSR